MRLETSAPQKAHELRSEQASCLQVSSDTGAKRRSSGVVGFVVVHRALYGEGLKAFAFGLILPQPGPSNDTIKDLDDLRSERARELALSAYGVLACRSALLMGGGSKREVGMPVSGDGATSLHNRRQRICPALRSPCCGW